MRFWHGIQSEARGLADRAEERIAAIGSELCELEVRRMSLETERQALALISSRFSDFKVSLGSNHLCPYCWMAHRKIAVMLLAGAEEDQQIIRCRVCEEELAA
jgi:hypothetical protein